MKFLKKIFHSKTAIKMKPKLLVAIFGIILFAATTFLKEEALADLHNLLLNISSALISVPILFICYDIWNDRSKKRINHYAIEKVDNIIEEQIDELETRLHMLMQGISCYFEPGYVEIDDTALCGEGERKIFVKMTNYGKTRMMADEDEDYENPAYSGEEYMQDMLRYVDEGAYQGGIYEYERSDMPAVLLGQLYCGFQILDLSFEDIVEQNRKLLQNTFIMQYIDEDNLLNILRLMDVVEHLSVYVEEWQEKASMFCRVVDLSFEGLDIEREEQKTPLGKLELAVLNYKDNDCKIPLDARIFHGKKNKHLKDVYVLNEDPHVAVYLGDLIYDVLNAIRQYRGTPLEKDEFQSMDYGYYD